MNYNGGMITQAQYPPPNPYIKWAKRLVRLSLQSALKAAQHHKNNKALHIAFRRNIDISIDLSPYPYGISQSRPEYIETPPDFPQDTPEYYAPDIMPKSWKFNHSPERHSRPCYFKSPRRA